MPSRSMVTLHRFPSLGPTTRPPTAALRLWMNRLLVGLGRGRLVVLLGLIFATFLLVVLPNMGQRSQAYAQAVGTPDTSLTYTPERLHAMLSAYGPIGRQAYLKARYSYDLAFPLTYGLFLASFVSYSFARTWPDRPDRRHWAGVALSTMVADLVENAALARSRRLPGQPWPPSPPWLNGSCCRHPFCCLPPACWVCWLPAPGVARFEGHADAAWQRHRLPQPVMSGSDGYLLLQGW